MCHSAKQGRADFCFEVLDLLAERRLADPNLCGGACEVPFLGDGEEVANVAEFHWPSPK